jgi:hypothetical protein
MNPTRGFQILDLVANTLPVLVVYLALRKTAMIPNEGN